jgi:hypothetical protein
MADGNAPISEFARVIAEAERGTAHLDAELKKIAFEAWLDAAKEQRDRASRRVGFISALVGVLAVVATGLLNVAQYRDARVDQAKRDEQARVDERAQRDHDQQQQKALAEAELEQRRRDYRLRVLDLQVKYYFEAVEAASIIANADLPAPTEPALLAEYARKQTEADRRFHQLYWGSLCVIESPDVERAMMNFRGAISQPARDAESIKQLSYQLAHACRDHIQLNYDARAQLGQISPKAAAGR